MRKETEGKKKSGRQQIERQQTERLQIERQQTERLQETGLDKAAEANQKAERFWMNKLILVLLFGMGILLLILPKSSFSEAENRTLAQLPQFTAKALFSGEYMEKLETYSADHFPFRDFFVSLKSEVDMLTGKKEIQGVYLCEENYLIGVYETPQNTQRIQDNFNRFQENLQDLNPEILPRLMLVPSAVTIYEERLPVGATPASQRQTIQQIYENTSLLPVEVEEILTAHKEEELFYHTDHHWTTLGAYYAYTVYCSELGMNPVPIEALQSQMVTEEFLGTYAAKVNTWNMSKDSIRIYTNPSDELEVYYTDTEERSDSLYNLEYVNQRDKYSLFLDNLHSLVIISNAKAETDRELLLIKDSYANSLLPFLTHHFKNIYVVDPRYYKNGPSGLVELYPEITDVLLLYNLSTLDTDTGIRGIY